MAISLGKKTPATPATPKAASKTPATPVTKDSSTPSWMKTGKSAQELMAEEEQKQTEKQEQNNRMRRFYMKEGETARLTFLDGRLNEDGVLDIPMFREHQLYLNNSWNNFITCTDDQEPCPVCEGGNESKLVGVLTVIDHRSYTSASNGKTYKDQRKLYVIKRNTFKLLQTRAAKQGGLAGCTFDVTRTGPKEASVGNDFDFVEKRGKSQLITAYPTLKDELHAANYVEEFPYYTAAELREAGFGGAAPVGAEKAPTETPDYSDEL